MLISLLVATFISPAFAEGKIPPYVLSYEAKFLRDPGSPTRVLINNGSEKIYVDVNPFGDNAPIVCNLLLTQSPRRHVVNGRFDGNLIELLPQANGSATIRFGDGQALNLYSHFRKSDEWISSFELDVTGSPILMLNDKFKRGGPLAPFLIDYFKALYWLESGEVNVPNFRGYPRKFSAYGKLFGNGTFEIEEIVTRMNYENVLVSPNAGQHFVQIIGKLSKSGDDYYLRATGNKPMRLRFFDNDVPSKFAGPVGATDLGSLMGREVRVQAVRGPLTLDIYRGLPDITFVRPL